MLRQHRRTDDPRALDMATRTLERMASGGMYDHVGGGFHRYSTDPRWLVPHFEKMLYDNALLVPAYLEAFQATGREEFATIAREILRYVERDMTSPMADSTRRPTPTARHRAVTGKKGGSSPGRLTSWRPCSTGPSLALVTAFYGVTPDGNFDGRSILHASRPLAEAAAELELEVNAARRMLDAAREALYATRAERPRAAP